IAVLVRDQHAVDARRLEPQAREAPLGGGGVVPTDEQHARDAGRISGFHHQAVSAAAAPERSEAEQRYFSCSWSSARMRCAVLELSAPPSLLRTLTMLDSFSDRTCTRYCWAFTFGSLEPNRRESSPRSESFFCMSLSGSA